jgi:PAS domain S-box-containing protein
VNSLLDFSRIEAGRAQASFEPVDLAASTAGLASAFRSALDRAGLRLKVSCPPLPQPVFVDRDMWEKILLNLLSNAFKFTFEGEIAVEVRKALDGKSAEISVRDTGTGIPAEELPRLFERFHRVEGARGRSIEGSGIGLALVQELVRLHGGTIGVDSEVDKGSTFRIRLPFGTDHLPKDMIRSGKESPIQAARTQAYVQEAISWLGADTDTPDVLPASGPEDLAAADGAQGERQIVLLADDNADMRQYVEKLLRASGYAVLAAADGEAALSIARSSHPDLVLSDVMMPKRDGFGLLAGLREDPATREIPVILLSARAGQEAEVEGLKAGADDYLAKPFAARELLARIETNLRVARIRKDTARTTREEIERRRRVESELRESQQNLEGKVAERTAELSMTNARLIEEIAERERAETSFEHLVQGVADYALLMLDASGIVSSWNVGAERIKGYRAHEIIGHHFSRFYTEKDRAAGIPDLALDTAAREGKFEAEGWRLRKDGSQYWASIVINPIRDETGALIGYAKITRDITERREAQIALARTQDQLAQAQKMEGIGQLTGGVAHDFNNLLTVIIGNLESVQRRLQPTPIDTRQVTGFLDQALRGAHRASSLTHRLLAFARRQPLDPKPVDVSRLLSGMSDLLRRSIGEQVSIETVLAGGLWQINVDPNQLETGIINLAVNARDAMPNGGKLTIETANAFLDEVYAASQSEVVPGQYVVISVTDTGSGMSRDVQARVFEPFFTTKDIGQGTGLGLSQVYGFVKQSGGHVKIYSELGHGTSVKLYLPRLLSDDVTIEEAEPVAHAPRSTGDQTILAVEDDDDVRAHSTGILRELGYTVIEAVSATAAIQALRKHPEIVLLFTDVGLPGGTNGRQLADAAQTLRPDLKVLFTSGYARNAIVHDGRLEQGVQLITKPFTYAALASKLSEVLAAPVGSERVLLVEDEQLVQMLAVDHLEELGYQVETASTATEAVNKVKLLIGDLAFAIVDVGLPDRKGDVLVSELRALYPQLPIAVASGYGEGDLRSRLGTVRPIAFIQKPYTRDDLEAAINELRSG